MPNPPEFNPEYADPKRVYNQRALMSILSQVGITHDLPLHHYLDTILGDLDNRYKNNSSDFSADEKWAIVAATYTIIALSNLPLTEKGLATLNQINSTLAQPSIRNWSDIETWIADHQGFHLLQGGKKGKDKLPIKKYLTTLIRDSETYIASGVTDEQQLQIKQIVYTQSALLSKNPDKYFKNSHTFSTDEMITVVKDTFGPMAENYTLGPKNPDNTSERSQVPRFIDPHVFVLNQDRVKKGDLQTKGQWFEYQHKFELINKSSTTSEAVNLLGGLIGNMYAFNIPVSEANKQLAIDILTAEDPNNPIINTIRDYNPEDDAKYSREGFNPREALYQFLSTNQSNHAEELSK
jgi:hypothetical protein